MNCPYHPNSPAIRVCQGCGVKFCNTCAPLKKGKTFCKNCRDDIAYVKEREIQRAIEAPPEGDEKYQPKGKDIQLNRIDRLVQKAEAKATHLTTVRRCIKHSDREAVAACCQCKKYLCEKCIAFEDKEDLFCNDCWSKIPLAKRLSRKSKGRW